MYSNEYSDNIDHECIALQNARLRHFILIFLAYGDGYACKMKLNHHGIWTQEANKLIILVLGFVRLV